MQSKSPKFKFCNVAWNAEIIIIIINVLSVFILQVAQKIKVYFRKWESEEVAGDIKGSVLKIIS